MASVAQMRSSTHKPFMIPAATLRMCGHPRQQSSALRYLSSPPHALVCLAFCPLVPFAYTCALASWCASMHTHTSAMHKRQHCHTHRHTACQTELFAIAKPLCITKHQALWTALVTVVDRKFGPQTKSQAGLVSCLEP